MSQLGSIEIKAFVPARNFQKSMQFYKDLGFNVSWSDRDLAYVCCGHCSFLLQDFYNKEHAENFMMHLLVPDVEAWWKKVEQGNLAEKYGVRTEPPEDRPWRIRDFILFDPTGVVWRIGENIDRS